MERTLTVTITTGSRRKAADVLHDIADSVLYEVARRLQGKADPTTKPVRRAVIKVDPGDSTRVEAYLPSNYEVSVEGGLVYITGHDNAGWTLDGYVIPRLASGLIFAEEVVL